MKTKDGKEIVDELCYCGAKKSEHASRMHLSGKVAAPGHGSCKETGCKQFTWKSWVFKKEAGK